MRRYTYCANNPLRYTNPDGHFFGALFCFITGAVVGVVTEYLTQKFIKKRGRINVKAIVCEGVVGGVISVIGRIGGAAKRQRKRQRQQRVRKPLSNLR